MTQPWDAGGVDLGVKTLAVLSTGESIPGPKAHRRLLAVLRRRSRALAHQGSANRGKAKAHLARLHARIATIRRDATHKATTRLARGWRRIVVEDLNVRGMAANRRLAARSKSWTAASTSSAASWTTRLRIYGATVIVADRWYPRAGPVPAAVRSWPNWTSRSATTAAPPAAWRSTGISTPHAILSNWPQALRSQPVEGRALARPPPAPRGSGPVA